MKIGLIDVDGHNFPNLALMRISAYHKAIGDQVEWWWSDFIHYDIVYMSKIFSDAYTKDVSEPLNADKVIKAARDIAFLWLMVSRCSTKQKTKNCRQKLKRCSQIIHYIRNSILQYQ